MTTSRPDLPPHWLHHDFSPWANRYVYWLRTPAGVLVAAAMVSVLCGLFVAPQGFVIAVGALVVLVLGVVWPWLGLRGVTCQLSFAQRRSREGEAVDVNVTIVNRWPWPVWGLEIERGFFAATTGVNGDETVVALACVGGWSRCEFQWQFRPTLRGRYPRTAPRLATAFPFGLWKASKPIAVSETLLVWPQTVSLDWFSLPSGAQRWMGAASQNHGGSDGERSGVRPWRDGDTLRSVHWALTARYNRFIVCERQAMAQSQAVVRVATSPAAHVGEGRDATLEWSLRIAASVAQRLLEQGTIVRLQLGAADVSFTPGSVSARRMLDLLANFETEATAGAPTSRRTEVEDFIVEIGTDRSHEKMPRHYRARVLRILLSTANFDSGAASCDTSLALPASTIILDDAHRTFDQFARGWRRQSAEVLRGS